MNSIRSRMNLRSVEPARLANPFQNRPDKEEQLWHELDIQQRAQFVPEGYGFLSGELGYGEYDPIEILDIGIGTKKATPIILPEKAWLPRTVLWVQALELMTSLRFEI